eukprot:9190739-Pyramimonas_sp.AAC.1
MLLPFGMTACAPPKTKLVRRSAPNAAPSDGPDSELPDVPRGLTPGIDRDSPSEDRRFGMDASCGSDLGSRPWV